MSTYQKYPAYKDSGVEWIGKIPEHWEVKRLKFVSIVQPSNVDKKTNEGELPVMLCNYSDVYNNYEINSNLDFMQASATAEELEKFRLYEGDVIVTKDSETPSDIAVPAYVKESFDHVICGYHLTQIKPKKMFGKYLFRLFQSTHFNAQFIVRANGVTRFGLPQHVINNAFIIKPPLEEQQAIASFLDRKTAQINELIAKKEALLRKLDEKRTAIITQAVTKGLDPSVPMKKSGVEWIGEIPKHWEVKQTRHIFKIYSGSTPKSGEELLWDGDIVWFTPDDLGNNEQKYISESRRKITDEGYKSCGTSLAKTNSIVLSTRAPIGHIALSTVPACCNQGCRILEPEKSSPEYWYYTMLSGIPILQSLGQGSTFMELPRQSLASFKLPYTPIKEQQAIAEHIEKSTATIDRQKAQVTEAIERLKEYRSALITDAVTGKMDVHSHRTKESLSA